MCQSSIEREEQREPAKGNDRPDGISLVEKLKASNARYADLGALQEGDKALKLADDLEHAISRAWALDHFAVLHQLRGQAVEAIKKAKEAKEKSTSADENLR